ncbi:MAG: pilus assembly protein PilM, partial [Planctomycetales bacterium]|nr:pilus assembly protein PilM [Planctomycetales bacterium]
MPTHVALEWDATEARIVVAQSRGGQTVIEQAFSVSREPRDPESGMDDSEFGQRLKAALTARDVRASEALIAVGRASIELRQLALPAAPDDELPDMVRFAAISQFASLGDDWPLDFFPLRSPDPATQTVVAAALAPKTAAQIHATCAAAGLKAARLALRPCAAASLLARQDIPPAHPVRLLIDMLAVEADLTVLVERDSVLMRTVRLPGGEAADELSASLLGEIRRTMAAAQNQLNGRRVTQIVLCGGRAEKQQMVAALAERLDVDVVVFDPFAGVEHGEQLRAHPPAHPERFAPLLGLLLDEAQERRPAIDFVNPRRPAA